MSSPLLKDYAARLQRGEIDADAAQQDAITHLEVLREYAAQFASRPLTKRFFKKRAALPAKPAGGIYIHGDVGRGKSMLMDMFYASLTTKHRRRVHFHAFMQEVHQRIFEFRQAHTSASTPRAAGTPRAASTPRAAGTPRAASTPRAAGKHDPLVHIARDIAREARVLCFDEFQVTNIADASIMGRLFEALFEQNVIVVATSNQAPDALYEGGLNRHRFLPFIGFLKSRVQVLELLGARDYRLARLLGHAMWFTPLDDAARDAMDERFHALTGGAAARLTHLEIGGRALKIGQSAQGVGRLSFADACGAARGASDYLVLARCFHTILLDAIPAFTLHYRDAALRFIVLIDILYEHRVKLLASSAVEIDALYDYDASLDGAARAISRLHEMQSQAYLMRAHGISEWG